jgi:hypothetical protein
MTREDLQRARAHMRRVLRELSRFDLDLVEVNFIESPFEREGPKGIHVRVGKVDDLWLGTMHCRDFVLSLLELDLVRTGAQELIRIKIETFLAQLPNCGPVLRLPEIE